MNFDHYDDEAVEVPEKLRRLAQREEVPLSVVVGALMRLYVIDPERLQYGGLTKEVRRVKSVQI